MTASVDASLASRPAPPLSMRWTLAALSLSMLLSSLGTSIANVALPTLAEAFHASFQQVQWVVLAYLLAVTALIVGVGRLGDILGRRRLLLAGLALFTVASVLCGLAPSLGLLIAARAAQGLGGAAMMALTLAFVGQSVPRDRTGRAMGLLGTMSAVGTALGPSLGGLIIAAFGWRAIFLLNLPLGVLAMALAAHALPPDRPIPSSERPRFDAWGTLLLAASLAAYALAMTLGRGHPGPLNAGLLGAALLALGLFARVQSRSPFPLIRLDLFQDPSLRAGFATSALVATVVMATLVVGPFFLSGALGLDAARVGLVMSAGPVVAALTGVPAGRLVDRFGASPMTLAGLVLMLAGCGLLALLGAAFGIPGYAGPLVVVTSGYALFQAANTTAVLRDVPTDRRGLVSGLLNLSRNLGLVTGASAMGAVFAAASGAGAPDLSGPAAVASGTQVTFAVAAALTVAALALAWRARGQPQPSS
ncbi:Putative transport protein [Rubellimicrobium mesophilum DSM 19309]|uniref:Putative transport protein n=1 Tax=Rubellimicrobium mesophilum DSM 19309 TaxID=442562 RepID=A0A017HIP6_9RHOB|nr:MFS transporter [Rubellimicrobium mesophilum]EYD74231.1 Putative transport protein [Rubellimicrobium mesophilum DSM 19309]